MAKVDETDGPPIQIYNERSSLPPVPVQAAHRRRDSMFTIQPRRLGSDAGKQVVCGR